VAVSAILRNHYGRGPMKAKTYALDDRHRTSGRAPLQSAA
jgi:hypothetical protein